MREALRSKRHASFLSASETVGTELADIFLHGVVLPPASCISFYYPFKDEMDVLPLVRELERRGHTLALPCILPEREDLVFRSYHFGDPTFTGVLGIAEPLPSAPVVQPDVLILPVLGFDRYGTRMGLGGGYYDRTLADLRAKKKTLVIGVAFAGQEWDELPFAPHDERLDLIVTEREIIDPVVSTEP